MRTILDESFAHKPEITFCGNRHREAIRMRYQDFRDLEHPKVAAIARITEIAEPV